MNHRICRVTLHHITVSRRTSWLMVELATSEGVVGTGECSDLRPIDSAAGILESVLPIIARHSVGEDPMALDRRMTAQLGPSTSAQERFGRRLVLGAVVGALCDIQAQIADQPLSAWLGAEPTDRVELYANINRAPTNRTPDEFAQVAVSAVEAGFRRIKLAPFDGPPRPGSTLLETGIAHLESVRDAIGFEPSVFVDVHHRLTEDELLPAVRSMEELGVGWIEDAVDVHQPEMLDRLAAMTDIPLAGGEKLTEEGDVAALSAGGWLTYLLLDPKYIGGPLRFREMLRATSNVTLTLHDPTGPISTAASAHLTMLTPDPGPLEYAFGENIDRSKLVTPGERLDGDRLIVSKEAGIGVHLADDHQLPDSRAQTWRF
ncbi:MAG TPA: enolase C-terminal domain-like protein [Acidimicrobiia bacterium]|nr:enolase C-terminal domain-like protein [Acidimicrobiia bacterium]